MAAESFEYPLMSLPPAELLPAVPLAPDGAGAGWPAKWLVQAPASELPRLLGEYRALTGADVPFRWLDGDDLAVFAGANAPGVWRDRLADDAARDSRVRVFREWAAGVWVEVGVVPAAPLPASFLARPSHQQVLIRSPGELVEFGALPAVPAPLALGLSDARGAAPSPPKFHLVPRLSGRPAEGPALWVITRDALAQLSQHCRTAGEQTLAAFEIAVTAMAGAPAVLVRGTAAADELPVFVAAATAYAPWQRRSNLFVPLGRRFRPPLRRDILLNALALRPDRLYWAAEREGGWRLESVPAAAFRPLPEWVEYRAPAAVAHGSWEQPAAWGPEAFRERAEPDRPRPDAAPADVRKAKEEKRKGLLSRAVSWLKTPGKREAKEPESPAAEAGPTTLRQVDRLHHARPDAAGGAAERCQQLEAVFLGRVATPAGDHAAAWAELAAAYDAAEKPADAALCWLNALWGGRAAPAEWAAGWLRAAAKEAQRVTPITDPAEWLTGPPTANRARAVAAWAAWAARQSPPPEGLTHRAAEVQNYLRAHEHWLPVRAAWLAQAALATFHRGDVLALARTRDRLGERLMGAGLSLELDTPPFLRFGDDESRTRHQEASKWLEDRRRAIHAWVAKTAADAPAAFLEVGLEAERVNTVKYVDLLIGWGLTRLSESLRGEAVVRLADEGFPRDNPVHGLLRAAFERRLQNLRDGRPARAPLPPGWHTAREQLPAMERYFVDKFCEHSRVLQPAPPSSAYLEAVFQKARQTGPATFALNRLTAVALNDRLPDLLRKEVAQRGPGPELARLTSAALQRVTELQPAVADAVFGLIPTALDGSRSAPAEWAGLVEHGLAAASYADRPDLAKLFVQELLSPANAGPDLPEALTAQAFRSLRRMGLKAEADRVLKHLAETATQGMSYAKLRKTRPAEWPGLLRTLLHVAAGWYYAGRDEPAFAVLEEAKADLFDPETAPANRTKLALAYVQTLGQAPFRVALGRLDELFQRLAGLHVRGTANRYFCLPVIQIVEASVRAVVADDLAGSAGVRAWLDADEVAVRSRIRDDLAESLKTQGLGE